MNFTVKLSDGEYESVSTLQDDDGFYYYNLIGSTAVFDRDMSNGPCENRDAVETCLLNEIPAVQAVKSEEN